MVEKKYKKLLNLFIICLLGLILVSSVYGADELQFSNDDVAVEGTVYDVSSDLSNNDIQSMLDNAGQGDTFNFVSKEYKGISLVVDKKVNIVSNVNSTIYTSGDLSNKVQELNTDKTFGFYFTKNSAGSVLSGFNIIAASSDYGVIVDNSDNTIVKGNSIVGAGNNLLVKDSNDITLWGNVLNKAKENGLQLQNVSNCYVANNTMMFNGRSGIEIYDIDNSNITSNYCCNNSFNGISLYGKSFNNSYTHNFLNYNTNGIYVNCQSSGDEIKANTLIHNIQNPNCELGGFESGNGLLFGDSYRAVANNGVYVSYNSFAHNENFQAKNNPLQNMITLGPNFFNSDDPENTFVCPLLLAKILRLNAISLPNGIGIQMVEGDTPVKEAGTVSVQVEVDGNMYTATLENGKAVIKADPNVDHQVEIQVGGEHNQEVKKIKQKVTSYNKKDDSGSSDSGNKDNTGSDGKPSDTDGDNSGDKTGDNSGSGDASGGNTNSSVISDGSTSSGDSGSANIKNSDEFSQYLGTNSSDYYQKYESLSGKDAMANGDQSSAKSSSSSDSPSDDGSSKEGKSYELVSPNKIAKAIQNSSGVIILAVIALLVLFVIGYKRKNKM
ncbi:NosD domain-containing protein [Methanobrevibacter intestini]|uniref:NosD domain-containing protein n=1 Tax=Methanobrevibacter intestini TaxID=2911853 RepID=UPI003CEB458F